MVPTTAGTGSEVTQNAIVLVPEEEVKIGVVSSKLVPDCAILDPLLTVKLPAAVTASTGMDALAHAIECYISKKANPFSDTYALRAVNLLSRSIRRAYNDGTDIDARHDMLLGAMFGGMCIATSSTTAVHALAYPLGGEISNTSRIIKRDSFASCDCSSTLTWWKPSLVILQKPWSFRQRAFRQEWQQKK